MGCISVKVNVIKGFSVSLLSERMRAKVSTYPWMKVAISTYPWMKVDVSVYPGMKVSVGIVCDANRDVYVRVNPDYIFLTPSNNFEDDIDIISNIIWSAT